MQSNLKMLAAFLVFALASSQAGASSVPPIHRAEVSPGSPGNAVSGGRKFELEPGQGLVRKPTLLAMQFDLHEGPSPSRPGRAVQSLPSLDPVGGLGNLAEVPIDLPRGIGPIESTPKMTGSVQRPSGAASSAPEPRNWAMVLAGLLSVGAIARRRMSS